MQFLAGALLGAGLVVWWLGFHPARLIRFLGDHHLEALRRSIADYQSDPAAYLARR